MTSRRPSTYWATRSLAKSMTRLKPQYKTYQQSIYFFLICIWSQLYWHALWGQMKTCYNAQIVVTNRLGSFDVHTLYQHRYSWALQRHWLVSYSYMVGHVLHNFVTGLLHLQFLILHVWRQGRPGNEAIIIHASPYQVYPSQHIFFYGPQIIPTCCGWRYSILHTCRCALLVKQSM